MENLVLTILKTFDLCSSTALAHLFRERINPTAYESVLRKLYKTREIYQKKGIYVYYDSKIDDFNNIYPLIVFADLEAGREIETISTLGKNPYGEASYFRDNCIYTLHFLADYEDLFKLENRINTKKIMHEDMIEYDKHILIFNDESLYNGEINLKLPFVRALVRDVNIPEIEYRKG